MECWGEGTALEAINITALAVDASANTGFRLGSGAEATLYGGSYTAQGGTWAYGIYNYESTLEAMGTNALGESGTYNKGINMTSAVTTLRGGSFTARGGDRAYGIENGTGSLTAIGVTALGENGTDKNYGLLFGWNSAKITNSVLEGADNAIYREGGSITVSHSRLIGGPVSGSPTCVAVSRGTTFNATGCP
jgi:hypothetical protein